MAIAGHGAMLRRERRKFASKQAQTAMTFEDEQADKLAISRMAETERQQLGETKRTTMQQLGQTERTRMSLAGALEQTGMREAGETERLGMRRSLGGLESKDILGIRTKAYDQLQKKWGGTRAPIWADPITGAALTPQQIRAKKREEWESLVKQYMGGF